MGFQQCGKCGEMVDEAKAFCPGCGNALVVESTRREASAYETLQGTMRLDNSMYNKMLSEMGLDISKTPNAPEMETIPAAAPNGNYSAPPAHVVEPIKTAPPLPQIVTNPQKNSNLTKWLLIGAAVLVAGVIVVSLAVIVVVWYWSRIS